MCVCCENIQLLIQSHSGGQSVHFSEKTQFKDKVKAGFRQVEVMTSVVEEINSRNEMSS